MSTREPVLAALLQEQRLPFTAIGKVSLPARREAVVYRANAHAPPLVTMAGENLVTARKRNGEDLFPTGKAEWQLPAGGRRAVGIARNQLPMEFQVRLRTG